MESTKIWKIENDKPTEFPPSKLDYEEKIHTWIEKDISLLDNNFILIGSKVRTIDGKELDLLALDSEGDLVVIELKRGKTPRDVVSQTLEYVSWVETLSEDEINGILQDMYPETTVQDLFTDKFGSYEETEINGNQKILIVGSTIDRNTERIVKYLSSKLVNINVTTFTYHKEGTNEFITRNVLLEDSEIARDIKNQTKREKSFFKQLFDNEKLKVGMKVHYEPLTRKTGSPNYVEIINTGTYCLKVDNDENRYSFSGLRKKIVKDYKIEDIRSSWGFRSKYEWYTENNTPLIDLL